MSKILVFAETHDQVIKNVSFEILNPTLATMTSTLLPLVNIQMNALKA